MPETGTAVASEPQDLLRHAAQLRSCVQTQAGPRSRAAPVAAARDQISGTSGRTAGARMPLRHKCMTVSAGTLPNDSPFNGQGLVSRECYHSS